MNIKEQPLVSVIIPCYNHESFVQECIQSVIDQDYSNIELIIIDDGSQDNSVKKIKELVDKCQKRFTRFKFSHRPNKGLSATLNEGLSWCNGLYFSPIASDDQMLPSKISLQVELLEDPLNKNIVATFGAINQIDNNSCIVRTICHKARSYQFDDIAKFRYFLPAATQMIRLENLKKIKGYCEDYKIEDWYSYLRLTQGGGEILLSTKVLCNYRRHENNSSKNMKLMEEKIIILKNIGLSQVEFLYYLPYIYLSIASDMAPFNKSSAYFYAYLSLKNKFKFIIDPYFWKVLIKCLIPKKMLHKNS